MAEARKPAKTPHQKSINPERRQKMIEQAAYYRAINSNHTSDPAADWMAAEKEIDTMLEEQIISPGKEEELAVFEKLRTMMDAILSRVRSIKADTFTNALDRATKEMKKRKEFTDEAIDKSAKALKKDMAYHLGGKEEKGESVPGKISGRFDFWSKKSAGFLNQARDAASHWLKDMGDKVSPVTYKSGDITTGGAFECKACKNEFTIEGVDHLPKCPACDNTEFKLKK